MKSAFLTHVACNCRYSNGRGHAPNNPMPRWLRVGTFLIGKVFATELNARHLNYYFTSDAGLRLHSDDESFFCDSPRILSLSLGATRDIIFEPRDNAPSTCKPHFRKTLGHGSLNSMSGAIQNYYRHGVLAAGAGIGVRINITWRQIVRNNCGLDGVFVATPAAQERDESGPLRFVS